MRPRRLTFLAAALAAGASCGSNDAASRDARAGATAADSSAPASAVPWFDGFQPLLLVPAHTSDRAIVVPADSLAPDMEDGALAQPARLVRLDGSMESVAVSLSAGSEGCVDAALRPAPAAAWGIGFVGGTPQGIHVDSLRSISRQDSIRLAPVLFRLASAVPNAPGGRFSGLPFSLADLWRLRAPDGSTIVVGVTRRQINQEDSPLEERTLIVAEGDSAASLSLVHSARSTGPEETVEGSDLLAALTFVGRPELELVFAHDYGDEGSYAIVERLARGTWKVRWVSGRISC